MPELELNFNENQYELIAETTAGTFGSTGDYIRIDLFSSTGNYIRSFYSGSTATVVQVPGSLGSTGTAEVIDGFPSVDFNTYSSNNNLYIKPNEIIGGLGLQSNNYKFKLEFLNQFNPPTTDSFIVKQISPSRLEVRLKLLNSNISSNSQVITNLENILGTPSDYEFKHVLYLGDGQTVPIVNYAIDSITDDEGVSIIDKLQIGQRFFTPEKKLEEALTFEAIYDASGLKS